MVRKLLTVVVAFRTTIPNRPSIITLFGCFRCLDFRIKDLLLYLLDNTVYKTCKEIFKSDFLSTEKLEENVQVSDYLICETYFGIYKCYELHCAIAKQ
jgi:hypothetical protein